MSNKYLDGFERIFGTVVGGAVDLAEAGAEFVGVRNEAGGEGNPQRHTQTNNGVTGSGQPVDQVQVQSPMAWLTANWHFVALLLAVFVLLLLGIKWVS